MCERGVFAKTKATKDDETKRNETIRAVTMEWKGWNLAENFLAHM
jgi:hypothetical protein